MIAFFRIRNFKERLHMGHSIAIGWADSSIETNRKNESNFISREMISSISYCKSWSIFTAYYNFYNLKFKFLLFWHFGIHIILVYHWVWGPALLLTSQKNSHFLIIHMTSDLKMSRRTALKRFPKDWNHFLFNFWMVLIL